MGACVFNSTKKMPDQPIASRPGKYWLATIPASRSPPFVPEEACQHHDIKYAKGQLEEGGTTGFRHWQVAFAFKRNVRLTAIKKLIGEGHYEMSRSDAVYDYVWKDETSVEGTRFEYGSRPMKRNSAKDWDDILDKAKKGKLEEIPSDVLIRCYTSLNKIMVDNVKPEFIEREIVVYWGKTGVGKSRKAWEEAGIDAYPKDPRSKFWDGYSGQEHVIIDEFRGAIDVSHMLRWLDRYPVIVEVKGSSRVLKAKKIWITSNLEPKKWYPDLDIDTLDALMRRLRVTHLLNKDLT